MNSTLDVILVNRCNQRDEFRTVLPAKMCVHVLVILMLAAAAVLVVGAGVGAAEKTWYVDDGGGAGIDYMKIQDAVNAAGEGDTIYVYAGTYNECLIIYKSLILQGENRETTIIDANGGNKGVEITANDCVINGFTIRNCWGTGIKPSSSSNGSIITNNIIHSIIGSSDCDGIEVTISSYNVISNNEIFDSDDEGIEIDGSSHNTVTNNTIYSNTEVGIDVRGSLHNYIANNTIYSNGEPGITLGRSWSTEPVVRGSSHNIITSNVIYLNDDGGIKLKNSSNNIITNNIVYATEDIGIYLKNSSDNQIYHNNLIDNDEQASDGGDNNSWDMGPVIGGNYWSDHACTGNPSDGSQPYYIDAGSIDHYPFADPIGELPPLPPPVPRTDVCVDKTERLSTSDTYIDHNQLYNFNIGWSAGIWDLKNLDNVTITITTPIDITYRHTWALYNNGSGICSVSPFTHTGDNYTWVLPLKDRFAASIGFYLPEKTVQSKPWADMVVNTMAEGDYTRVNVTVIPRTASISVEPSIRGKIIDFSYPPEFEVDMFFPDHRIDFDGDWEDLNQGQSYNFSILVDEPKKVGLWLDKIHGGGSTEYSDRSTVPVSELGSVMVEYDVPVKWELDATYPLYAQSITITIDEGPTPPQTGDLNGDDRITPTDAAIALAIAASGAHDDAADVSGDGHVTSLDALMILQAAAENMEL